MDWDEVAISILDNSNNHEDVVINAFDDIVFIRQWDESLNRFQVISISPQQWEELIAAINSPEGAFIVK